MLALYDAMMNTARYVLLALLSVILACAAIVLCRSHMDTDASNVANSSTSTVTLSTNNDYVNTAFGYEVHVPEDLVVRQLLPEFAEIGTGVGNSFMPMLDIAVVHAGSGKEMPPYEDFVRLSASLACGFHGGQGGGCMTVQKSEPFTSASGLSGEKLSFGPGTPSPIYAFNITSNVSGGGYGVLLIYAPSVPVDATLLDSAANSLKINSK